MEEKRIGYNVAVPCRNLDKDDLNHLINLAKECLNKEQIIYKKENKYSLNELLEELYYTLGGDYPNDESVDHAELHANSIFYKIEEIIKKLSYDDLRACINDISNFSKKLE